MADSNLLKRGEPRLFDDNDPFAELTRIMGQEPQRAGHSLADDDDFGIDLEKEMLGDLEPEAAGETVAEPVSGHTVDVNAEPVELPVDPSAVADDQPSEEAFDDAVASTFDAPDWQDDTAGPLETELPRYEISAGQWQPEQVAEANVDAGNDLGLAEVDMDFGDLDFSEDDAASEAGEPLAEDATSAVLETSEPVAAVHPLEQDTAEWEPALEDEPSLEDELGMLLSGDDAQLAETAPTSEADEDWRGEETAEFEAETVPYISLGRANFTPVDENRQPAASAAEAGAEADADAGWGNEAAWDEPLTTGQEPEEECDPLPEAQPDPFAVFSTIAPRSAQAQPAVASAAATQHFEPVEEMDTVEIQEAAPDMGDQPAAVFDDYDAEFAQVFGDMGGNNVAASGPVEADGRAAEEFDEDLFAQAGDFGVSGTGAASAEYPAPSWHSAGRDYADFQSGQADALEREIDVAAYGSTADSAGQRRNGMLIAAAVLAVAVVGGVGAFALSFGGGGDDDAPAVVQADGEPLKVKPENPGGTTVPNQDSQAYERVAGDATTAGASQERLVTTAEEPVDLAARVQPEGASPETGLPGVDEDLTGLDEPDVGAAGKSEERVEAPPQETAGVGAMEDLAAVQPRRVRTMIVRPDGTLVPREDPAPSAPAASALGPIASQSQESLLQPAPSNDTPPPSAGAAETIAQPAAQAIREVSTQVQAEPVAAAAVQTAPAPAVATDSDTPPATGPIVPERPAQTQRTQPQAQQQQQVAQAAAPAPTQPAVPQAAAGEWSMQIASQPTADGAQATYQDLARRYGGIIGGHGVNIVRADIPGKGTYYRVRIPSNTRAEAISLCEKYKAAGGSCFVSK